MTKGTSTERWIITRPRTTDVRTGAIVAWARAGTAAALVLVVVILPGPWGRDPVPPPGRAVPGVPGDPARVARLFQKLDCTRFHTEPRSGSGIDVPPSLDIAGSRARTASMAGRG